MISKKRHGRHPPSVHSPHSSRLLRVIRNIWTKAINCVVEMVVSTSNEVPRGHVRYGAVIHHNNTPMEETTVEVAEDFALSVLVAPLG